jgi:hypothetical protein
MSWDVCVQDLPKGVKTVKEISTDFMPRALGKRAELIQRIRDIVPEVEFADPSWGQLEGDGYSIEINIGDCDVVKSFAIHARGDEHAPYVVHLLLEGLRLRALDPSSENGIF